MENLDTFDCIVIDNTAFASGFDLNIISIQNPDVKIFLTSQIYEEALNNTRSAQMLDIAAAQGLLRIRNPSPEALKKVVKAATKTGDIGAISKPDQSILALYIDVKAEHPEWKIILMSDDYSVQNTGAELNITILPYSKEGIKERIEWEIYCSFCYRTYPPDQLGKECENCGGTLKRRAKRNRDGRKKKSKRRK